MNTRPSRSANGRAARHRLVDVRQHVDARAGLELGEQVALDRGHHQRDVGLADDVELLRRAWRGRARGRARRRRAAPARSLRRKCRSTVSNTTRACGAKRRTASRCFAAT